VAARYAKSVSVVAGYANRSSRVRQSEPADEDHHEVLLE